MAEDTTDKFLYFTQKPAATYTQCNTCSLMASHEVLAPRQQSSIWKISNSKGTLPGHRGRILENYLFMSWQLN